MDATWFGLRQRPFPVTPDSACYYPANTHEQVLAQLSAGLDDGEGLFLVSGEPGIGKTLLCHCLVERLGSSARTAFLTNSHFRDRAALLQAVLFDLSQPYQGMGEQEMRLALTEYLLRTCIAGQPTLLLVDEAQHLTPDLLEELRLLTNIETRTGKALQVVLLGQAGLTEALQLPELSGLCQRLALRVQLQPLDLQESVDYVLHHLRIAGAQPGQALFTEEALEQVARASGGIPRRLNQLCRQSMSLAGQARMKRVDYEAVLEAMAGLGLEPEEDVLPLKAVEPPGPARQRGTAVNKRPDQGRAGGA
jgi:type II secretory pathway predicted ATPase ExeA